MSDIWEGLEDLKKYSDAPEELKEKWVTWAQRSVEANKELSLVVIRNILGGAEAFYELSAEEIGRLGQASGAGYRLGFLAAIKLVYDRPEFPDMVRGEDE